MTVCGIPLARSSAALALYLLAESVARLGLLAGLLLAFPDALRFGTLLPDGSVVPLLLAVGAVVVVAVTVLALLRRLRAAVLSFLRTALGEAALGAHPSVPRARAVGRFPRLPRAAGGRTGRWSAWRWGCRCRPCTWPWRISRRRSRSPWCPTPGGLGSVEAALVVALVAAGGPVAVATAVVLAYRIITVWLPLLPGALTLGALVRLKVI